MLAVHEMAGSGMLKWTQLSMPEDLIFSSSDEGRKSRKAVRHVRRRCIAHTVWSLCSSATFTDINVQRTMIDAKMHIVLSVTTNLRCVTSQKSEDLRYVVHIIKETFGNSIIIAHAYIKTNGRMDERM